MYKKLAIYLTELLIRQNIIKRIDCDIYYYSFELLLSTLVSTTGIVAMAIVSNQFLNTLIFFLGFILCRSVSGGYHAKNHVTCFALTQIVFLSFILIATFFKPSSFLLPSVIISIANSLLILIFAPVDDPNKSFSKKEKIHYKKCSKIFVVMFCFPIILLILFPLVSEKYFYFLCGIFAVAILIILGKIKNFTNSKKEKGGKL